MNQCLKRYKLPKERKKVKSLNRVWLFATPWTVACQPPLSMEFSRQEYCSELPFPLPGDLPDLGMEPEYPASPVLSGRFFTASATWEAPRVQFSSVQSLSCVWLFATLWIVVRQAPLSVEFSRQEYWRGLPFPLPGDLPDAGIEPVSPALQADSLPLSHQGSSRGRLLVNFNWHNSAICAVKSCPDWTQL